MTLRIIALGKLLSRLRRHTDTLLKRIRQRFDGKPYLYTRRLMRMFYDLVSTTVSSGCRVRVMRTLETGPLDQRNIARLARLERANAQRTIRDLCKRKLIECLTPNQPRSKVYRLTRLGQQVYDSIKDWGLPGGKT